MQQAEPIAISRRRFLTRWGGGFGALALCGLMSCPRRRGSLDAPTSAAHARSVIFLYMEGGPSQMDTFDPKPRLAKEHGQAPSMPMGPTQFKNSGKVMKSPFSFQRHGDVGADVSEIFPHLATTVDELTLVRSMVTEHHEHTSANYFLNTGFGVPGRPSMGSWISYGLGDSSQELPAYVVLECGHFPLGGRDCFSNGFLPPKHQGSIWRSGPSAMPDLTPRESPDRQRAKLSFIERLNRLAIDEGFGGHEIEARIANHEMAFRMQASVPSLLDISNETKATRDLYGLDDDATTAFGRQCLVARRLVERGVRFIQLLPPKLKGITSWDQHNDLGAHHRANARATDRPIQGLLRDLRGRGLLDKTVVLWGGEFGRTPTAQLSAGDDFGRDHNPHGFTMWLAGGGFRRGHLHGATDEYGYQAVDAPVTIHDLHATILHRLGIDHTQLTYRHGGRDYRLTDVEGEIVTGLLSSPPTSPSA